MTWGTNCPKCGEEKCSWSRGHVCEGSYRRQAAHIEALEAERDRLREALEVFTSQYDSDMGWCPMGPTMTEAVEKARAALAGGE